MLNININYAIMMTMKIRIHPEARIVATTFFPVTTAFVKLTHCNRIIPEGITQQQMKIIMELNSVGCSRLSDLSRCAAVTHGTMTVAVQKLLKKGLVAKTKDPQDERAVSLTLTAQGKKVSKEIEKGMEELFHTICEKIPKNERKKLAECYRFLLKTYQKVGEKKGAGTNE